MAHQVRAWRYEGDIQVVAAAVDRAINKLTLNVKDRHDSHSRFSRVAAEKINWLSTNWPFKVEVTGSVEGDSVLIEVEAKSAPSLTAGGNIDRKIGELINLVKAYLPVN